MTTTIRSAGSMPASVNAFSKARRWLSVSTVPPDLEDTTTTVSARRSSRAVRTKSGSEESSTSRSTPAAAADHLGRERRAAHAAEHDLGQSALAQLDLERGDLGDAGGASVSGRSTQPSRFAGLLLGRLAPQRGVAGEEPAGHAVGDQLLDRRGQRRLVGVAEPQVVARARTRRSRRSLLRRLHLAAARCRGAPATTPRTSRRPRARAPRSRRRSRCRRPRGRP